MEVFLNSLWLALAAAAVLGLLRKRQGGSDLRALVLGLCALCCAAALLFPAISITDDLHCDALVVEDSSSTKRLVQAIHHAPPPVDLAWFGLLALSAASVCRPPGLRAAGALFSYENPLLVRSPYGRAPPRSLPA